MKILQRLSDCQRTSPLAGFFDSLYISPRRGEIFPIYSLDNLILYLLRASYVRARLPCRVYH